MKRTLVFVVLCSISIISCGVSKIPEYVLPTNECIVLSSEIHGGEPSLPQAWPSTVAITAEIRGKHKQYCSGVLVSDDIVLTAAHCLIPWLKPFDVNLRVYIGPGQINGEYEGQYEIKEAKVHPEYLTSDKNSLDIYDFAYLILKTPVDLDQAGILPVIQTEEKMQEIINYGSKNVTIVGYGYTEEMSTGVKYEVETSIHSSSKTELFIGGSGKDSCRGDSGGPVLVKLGHKYHVLGITSRGSICGGGGVYGKINVAVEWIKKELGTVFPYKDVLSTDC